MVAESSERSLPGWVEGGACDSVPACRVLYLVDFVADPLQRTPARRLDRIHASAMINDADWTQCAGVKSVEWFLLCCSRVSLFDAMGQGNGPQPGNTGFRQQSRIHAVGKAVKTMSFSTRQEVRSPSRGSYGQPARIIIDEEVTLG